MTLRSPLLISQAGVPRSRLSRGRPRPMGLSSVFLLQPTDELKLDGHNVRDLLADVGHESVARALDRLNGAASKRQAAALRKSLSSLASFIPGQSSERTTMAMALAGDRYGLEAAGIVGDWTSFVHGLQPGRTCSITRRLVFDLAARTELAALPALRAMQAGDFERCARLISEHPLLAPCASPHALSALASARDNVQSLPAQLAMACEFRLSQIALVEARTPVGRRGDALSGFQYLTRVHARGACRPGHFYMRWLMDRLQFSSPGAWLNAVAELAGTDADDDPVSFKTLKAWCAGSIFPSGRSLSRIVRPRMQQLHGNGARYKSELLLASHWRWAALRLHTTVNIARRLESVLSRSPGLLYSHGDADSWLIERYAAWCRHWRATPPIG